MRARVAAWVGWRLTKYELEVAHANARVACPAAGVIETRRRVGVVVGDVHLMSVGAAHSAADAGEGRGRMSSLPRHQSTLAPFGQFCVLVVQKQSLLSRHRITTHTTNATHVENDGRARSIGDVGCCQERPHVHAVHWGQRGVLSLQQQQPSRDCRGGASLGIISIIISIISISISVNTARSTGSSSAVRRKAGCPEEGGQDVALMQKPREVLRLGRQAHRCVHEAGQVRAALPPPGRAGGRVVEGAQRDGEVGTPSEMRTCSVNGRVCVYSHRHQHCYNTMCTMPWLGGIVSQNDFWAGLSRKTTCVLHGSECGGAAEPTHMVHFPPRIGQLLLA
jgi:hypothetical protein